ERVARRAAWMADVRDEARALSVNRRLVGRPALEIVVAHQLHVAGLGAVTARRGLRGPRPRRERNQDEPEQDRRAASQQGTHGYLLSTFAGECGQPSRRGDDTP